MDDYEIAALKLFLQEDLVRFRQQKIEIIFC